MFRRSNNRFICTKLFLACKHWNELSKGSQQRWNLRVPARAGGLVASLHYVAHVWRVRILAVCVCVCACGVDARPRQSVQITLRRWGHDHVTAWRHNTPPIFSLRSSRKNTNVLTFLLFDVFVKSVTIRVGHVNLVHYVILEQKIDKRRTCRGLRPAAAGAVWTQQCFI